MSTAILSAVNSYLHDGHYAEIYTVGDAFSIVEGATFMVLPNHPYRSPLVVALYCRAGHGTGCINTRRFEVRADSFFIVLPNQITELIDVSDDFDAVYILMDEEFTQSIGLGNTFNLRTIVAEHPHTTLTERARESLEDYISMCKNLIPIESNPHRLDILRLLTHAFFLGLGYFLHECDMPLRQSRKAEIADEFLRMVEANYREHRDIGYYAERMRLTPKHLSTAVKQASGNSGVEWIERYVVLDAKTQLCTTERTVKQIAYDLNFPSQSFFGKYFSRIVGLSPAAYRRRHKQ